MCPTVLGDELQTISHVYYLLFRSSNILYFLHCLEYVSPIFLFLPAISWFNQKKKVGGRKTTSNVYAGKLVMQEVEDWGVQQWTEISNRRKPLSTLMPRNRAEREGKFLKPKVSIPLAEAGTTGSLTIWSRNHGGDGAVASKAPGGREVGEKYSGFYLSSPSSSTIVSHWSVPGRKPAHRSSPWNTEPHRGSLRIQRPRLYTSCKCLSLRPPCCSYIPLIEPRNSLLLTPQVFSIKLTSVNNPWIIINGTDINATHILI